MEKGEVAVLAIQFSALIIAVLVLSNFAYGSNSSSNPAISAVWWGSPPPGHGVSLGKGTNDETVNASTISVFYTLPYGTRIIAPVTAYRLCQNPNANNTGVADTYSQIVLNYSATKKTLFFTFGPVEQSLGWTCQYSISFTDSLQNVATWTGTVILKANATSPSDK